MYASENLWYAVGTGLLVLFLLVYACARIVAQVWFKRKLDYLKNLRTHFSDN